MQKLLVAPVLGASLVFAAGAAFADDQGGAPVFEPFQHLTIIIQSDQSTVAGGFAPIPVVDSAAKTATTAKRQSFSDAYSARRGRRCTAGRHVLMWRDDVILPIYRPRGQRKVSFNLRLRPLPGSDR
jgi:hypothetical protein